VKLIIDGREYPAVTHENAELWALMQLKQQTRQFTEDGKGLGMRALAGMLASAKDAKSSGEIPEYAELWLAVVIYLSRVSAGDRVTFEEATRVPFGSVEVVQDPGDEVEADPTTPGNGGPETPAAPAPEVPAA
jgi:hypothetical protein